MDDTQQNCYYSTPPLAVPGHQRGDLAAEGCGGDLQLEKGLNFELLRRNVPGGEEETAVGAEEQLLQGYR